MTDTVNLQSAYNSYGADRIHILANLADTAVVNGEQYQQNLHDNLVDREATAFVNLVDEAAANRKLKNRRDRSENK